MEQNPRTSSSSSEDDYISMEVDDVTLFHHHHHLLLLHHHHHHRRHRSSSAKEFEFQSFSSSSDADRSPADELFYMGKLLPLHLPPRLQMVDTILLNQNHHAGADDGEELFATPLANTPFQSCNITPSESCHVSAELDPEEYFRDHLTEAEKSTAKSKKSSGIGLKLNWGYFKSLFTKSSGCSNPYSAAAAASKIRPIPKQCAAAKGDSRSDAAPFGQIRYKKCNKSNSTTREDDRIDYRRGGKGGGHRRSFSGAFKPLSKPRNSSNPAPPVTASESSSNSKNYRQILKRCSSSNCSSEMENPIQAAIAHCKRSQQRPLMAAANGDELGFLSSSAASRAIYGEGKGRAEDCRG